MFQLCKSKQCPTLKGSVGAHLAISLLFSISNMIVVDLYILLLNLCPLGKFWALISMWMLNLS